MKETKISCHHCGGSGELPLSPEMQATLNVITAAPKSSIEIGKLVNDRWVKMTAINNRLAHLNRLGLIKRERRGRTLYWHRA